MEHWHSTICKAEQVVDLTKRVFNKESSYTDDEEINDNEIDDDAGKDNEYKGSLISTIREVNKERNTSFRKILMEAYVQTYGSVMIFDHIDEFNKVIFSPRLNENQDGTLANKVHMLEEMRGVKKFDAFSRTSKRQLCTILDTITGKENCLELFQTVSERKSNQDIIQDTEYNFSEIQSEIIILLLKQWNSEPKNAMYFGKKLYNRVDPVFLESMRIGVRYMMLGCFEEEIDWSYMSNKWDLEIKNVPLGDWMSARKALREAIKTLKDTMYTSILICEKPETIYRTMLSQEYDWTVEDQTRYMEACATRIIQLTNELIDSSLLWQAEFYPQNEWNEHNSLIIKTLQEEINKRNKNS